MWPRFDERLFLSFEEMVGAAGIEPATFPM